jgi:hypothetical protein
MLIRNSVLPALFASLALPAFAAERVVLIPHRAVYDLVLDASKPARGIEAAKARVVFDFSGDACDGYQLNFRQVTQLDASEGGRKVIDSRSNYSEAADGARFRFISENRFEGAPPDKTDGEARRDGPGYKVTVKPPKSGEGRFDADVLFPSAQLKAIIRAARAGETTFGAPLFDGSDDGKSVFDTLAVIGKRIPGGPSSALEPALRKPAFENVARWPVTVSYFKRKPGETTPSYVVSFELFENGVTRAVKLDYGDFALVGSFTSLDLLPASDCAR